MHDILNDTTEAIYYLKQGFVLIVVETRTIVAWKENHLFLQNENWHTTMKEADFHELFSKNTFVIYESKEIEIGNDEEYYKWRNKYL